MARVLVLALASCATAFAPRPRLGAALQPLNAAAFERWSWSGPVAPPQSKKALLQAVAAFKAATAMDGNVPIDFGVSGGELDKKSRAPRNLFPEGFGARGKITNIIAFESPASKVETLKRGVGVEDAVEVRVAGAGGEVDGAAGARRTPEPEHGASTRTALKRPAGSGASSLQKTRRATPAFAARARSRARRRTPTPWHQTLRRSSAKVLPPLPAQKSSAVPPPPQASATACDPASWTSKAPSSQPGSAQTPPCCRP
ncbi:plastid-lipid associated protein / fibrillin family protein [Aureococcus anophagefferens]|uniref:Plastid-lipid associated protein / fibrillin family protein n=1 Tax=Aureococcus anophagefferens TaxID=44056 RepID=A0ABR1FMU8_AURAN